MTDNDYTIMSIYIVFGFFITVLYANMVRKYTGNSSNIWSNNGKNIILKTKYIKTIYTMMILLSFVAGLYLVYYLTTSSKNQTDEILIYTGSVFFLVFSLVWAYNPFYNYSSIVLFLVAMSTILILTGISINSENPNEPRKIVALIAASILVLQTNFFDFGLWTGLIKF